ncbi:MAG: aldehyde dehydrogenase family protein [Nevskiaceae bacterium]
MSEDSLLKMLGALRRAQARDGVPDAAMREDRLRRLMALLDVYAERFCETLDADFGGRSRETSLMNDLLATFEAAKYAKSNVRRWMKPQRRRGVFPFNLFGARVDVQSTPKGVVGILGTWNVPLFTTLSPLSFVLAAGNRAMIKPSEQVPQTSALLESAIAEFFGADEIAVVQGGAEVSAHFSTLPFDHLIFTGSGRTGRLVMRAAAEQLTPVTLELGGKSPVIIGRSADLASSVYRVMAGKVMNSGQLCVSPDTVYVPAESLGAFVEACRAAYARVAPASVAPATAIVNDHHQRRLQTLLDDARSRDAEVVVLGAPSDATSRKTGLALILKPPSDARISSEEIFGPLLEVHPYEAIDAVLDRIAAGPAPLALYYFGRDAAEERAVVARTRSGGVTINDVPMHVAVLDAPFGGVGGSGFGRYHGREGFDEFSHARTVYRSGWWDPRASLGLDPPYRANTYEQLRRMLRR